MKTLSKSLTTKKLESADSYSSLYVHVPFCKNICDYCALYSVVNNDSNVRSAYLKKINHQLSKDSRKLTGLKSIFIGGGTPTQLSYDEMTLLLESINKNTSTAADCEFTVECNPATVDKQKLDLLKNCGVNRLSFGAQSTTKKTRRTLGRRTSHRQLLEAINTAKNCGFKNINIDLIYGIPGQEMSDWEEDLNAALELNLPHYSAYSLILEEGTVLFSQFSEVDDEIAVEMYQAAGRIFAGADLKRYEISNYCKEGFKCRHNYDIWKGTTYLGIGPAACSFDGSQRMTEIRDLNKWLKDHPPEEDILTSSQRLAEIVAFGFRTVEGWRKTELENLLEHNCIQLFGDIFAELHNEGLIAISDDTIAPTPKGLLFADSVAEAFL